MNSGSSGEVDPMIPGNKIVAIYGFCDIRQFTDTTEILQEDVLIFVNDIAAIVHETIDFFTGSANKNIGDGFLVVWMFPEQLYLENPETKEMTVKKEPMTQQRADMAVISILKVLSEIKGSKALENYKKNDALNAKFPGFEVILGFGLHLGWAVEGAIGSDFKIDASYLSPNVNLAQELEEAAKTYATPLLLTGEVYDILTD